MKYFFQDGCHGGHIGFKITWKTTPFDQGLVLNIQIKFHWNPSSGRWGKESNRFFKMAAMASILDLKPTCKITTLNFGWVLNNSINFHWNPSSRTWVKVWNGFFQDGCHGCHIGFKINLKNNNIWKAMGTEHSH